MIAVKLKNVSVNSGKKFRHNQNYSIVLFKHVHNVDGTTTLEDVEAIINQDFKGEVKLNSKSIVEIVENTDIK